MTRTPLSRLKGQRSRSPGRFTHRGVNASGSCSGERGNVLSVGTYCYVAVWRRGRLSGARRFGSHRRGAGAYCGGRPPTACQIWYTITHQGQKIFFDWLHPSSLKGRDPGRYSPVTYAHRHRLTHSYTKFGTTAYQGDGRFYRSTALTQSGSPHCRCRGCALLNALLVAV